ncbi:SH3 domain-containing protein [Leptobacterium flavescens]|uniref:SH3 domain-containing protein n=1 Tax=Leptobacterium flavescens TaxID=472055 RepID=A0A6P0UGX2_9FLAO|nr:C40 family peptidase [Leptobacterium flavescens]NER11882.1 SH3 domain-containing protein [Leptobacterium flavescens]
MRYGICNLGIVPLRAEPSDASEMVSQLLFGDHFKVLEQRKKWSRIRIAFDKYEGWIDNKQFLLISEEEYTDIDNAPLQLSGDLIEFLVSDEDKLTPVTLGASVGNCEAMGYNFDGARREGQKTREELIETAYLYLNTPYLWGGKTPFGIDCSGFTQMVYKLNGYELLRDACEQATQGEPLSFIEESKPGDLAFFDNDEGKIIHVGIIMKDNYIIHSHGKVRIDRIDHTGIFNTDIRSYSHKLRVIKSILPEK